MSVLLILFAPRPHLGPRAAPGADGGLRTPAEFDYVLSKDGAQVHAQGRCGPALLPKADSVVAVLPASDLAWHRLTIPKAPAGKLRAALAGLLEDALLEDSEDVHYAIAPQAQPGQEGWVAVTQRAWLRLQIDTLESANVFIDRIVPQAEPADPPRGHFEHDPAAEESRALRLIWARPDGVMVLHPGGTLARTWLPQPAPQGMRWSAEPGAAEAAEHWLGQPVAVLPRADTALRAADSAWNLRQFDFALRHRGVRALRDTLRQLGGPEWRPMRWGLIALVVVNLIGLNAWAWHQRSAVDERRQAQLDVLRQAFPHVSAVLDAPVQMQREAEQLRAKAGKPGDTDLEPMLQAAASAWPADRVLEGLRFETGVLTLSVQGWRDDEIETFRGSLQPAGWRVERDGSRLTLRRNPAGGGA
ncbi:type II secretion system protein GspL [Aquabacterium sp. A7-Y]|uniref:type II secretion system protein GspL n=1 Tax=Aquabacterium sp. A7-Y TaxID=1349605 RepID=UPI00223DD6A0|nr:type II secretion system protein GspL [Aquabacterium sp. A7-Y]MCW7539886.1 type II secretion system protein GspL [Aquabacterium sp. A7-Y]